MKSYSRFFSSMVGIMFPLMVSAFTLQPSSKVDDDFRSRMKDAPDNAILKMIQGGNHAPDEVEALKFLYAYMPTPDAALTPTTVIEESVTSALRAMDEMPWGNVVPQREFLHFVLPMRVNNENLDSCRPLFYAELSERVRNLSMEDAILEVNHWCHEKATYQPSDGRTSSPLSTVSQAIGRCGEESTFAVAALRSVGIPARQVYTPRWAHTDDNHAWVEAWANGKWHFIGACEPEPILDLAWFNEPASRGIMMTTNVIGDYDGPEEVLSARPGITTINVTSTYTPVDTLRVIVKDKDGTPAVNVPVRFGIYNYAEFYPVTTKMTDGEGRATLLTGFGDMVVWASDGENFGFVKRRPDGGIAELELNHNVTDRFAFDLDIVPPRGAKNTLCVSDEMRNENNLRLAREDSIRRAYTSTFFTEERATSLADSVCLDVNSVVRILTEARGNGGALAQLLSEAKSTMTERKLSLLLQLLLTVSEKDRRDISQVVINDNLDDNVDPADQFAVKYVLSPRIEKEPLSPYKRYFRNIIPESLQSDFRENPEKLVVFITENISDDDFNPQRLAMRPVDVWRWGRGDERSKKILFVAMARSFAIPSRIDPTTGNLQYADKDRVWRDVNFEKASSNLTPKGEIDIEYTPEGHLQNPKYYTHFSLLKLEKGFPSQLEFDENDGLGEISQQLKEIETGQYMLLSGQRQADGSVLVHGEIFPVEEGKSTEVPLTIRKDDEGVSVIGSLNAENLWQPVNSPEASPRSILSQTGRGYYILGLLSPGDEPTSHALRDIASLKSEFDNARIPILFLFDSRAAADRFDFNSYPAMPNGAVYGIDCDSTSLKEIVASLNLPTSDRPIFVIADTFNRIVFVSQGYTIGLGNRLLDILAKIR